MMFDDATQNFWTRLASKYGNKFFWQEQGEASAMLNAVSHATAFLPPSPFYDCPQTAGKESNEGRHQCIRPMMVKSPLLLPVADVSS